MKTLILGDVHGCWDLADIAIADALSKHQDIERIIQVGDMGFFPNIYNFRPWTTKYEQECLWIDGNHENHDILLDGWPEPLPEHMEDWLAMSRQWQHKKRGHVEDGVLFIGGAKSIDRAHRMEGIDWFRREVLSYSDQHDVMTAIDEDEIHTVISHDCPEQIAHLLKSHHMESDSTRAFLGYVLDEVKPDNWYFGHHHCPTETFYKNTRLRGMDMMRSESIDYEIMDV